MLKDVSHKATKARARAGAAVWVWGQRRNSPKGRQQCNLQLHRQPRATAPLAWSRLLQDFSRDPGTQNKLQGCRRTLTRWQVGANTWFLLLAATLPIHLNNHLWLLLKS